VLQEQATFCCGFQRKLFEECYSKTKNCSLMAVLLHDRMGRGFLLERGDTFFSRKSHNNIVH
jgi:hypothetical protein